MIFAALCYPLVCLLLGTVAGSASWWREAVLHTLAVIALMAAFRAARRERWPQVGGRFEPVLALLFVVLVAGALQSPCAGRTWRQIILVAAAATVFYIVLGSDETRLHPLRLSLPLTAVGAALIGFIAYLGGFTASVAAPLGHHNYMAGFLLLHLPLLMAAAETADDRLRRSAWFTATAFVALAIVFTGSLAGVLVLGFMVVWRLLQLPGRARNRIAVALLPVIALAVALSLGRVTDRLRLRAVTLAVEGRDPSLSFENRMRYLRTAVAMMPAHPLAGAGLGSVPLVSARYREQTPGLTPPGEVLRQLHSVPANLLAETGLLGLTAVLFLFLAAMAGRVGPAAAAIWAYAVFSLADYQLDVPAVLLPVAIVAALAMRGEPVRDPALPERIAVRLSLLAFAAAGFILFGLTAAAHFNYDRGNAQRAAQWDALCGFHAWQAGEVEEAAAAMPDFSPVVLQAGSALMEMGRYSDSIEYLERAARLDYYHTLAHFHLGRARLRAGNRDGAISAFAAAILVQPATVLAESWNAEPERDVYAASVERAIDELYEAAAFYPNSGPARRWNELGAFLIGRRAVLPNGRHRIAYFEEVDRDLAVNHSLIVFRRPGRPSRIAPVVLLADAPKPKEPAGIGNIAGLPSYRVE